MPLAEFYKVWGKNKKPRWCYNEAIEVIFNMCLMMCHFCCSGALRWSTTKHKHKIWQHVHSMQCYSLLHTSQLHNSYIYTFLLTRKTFYSCDLTVLSTCLQVFNTGDISLYKWTEEGGSHAKLTQFRCKLMSCMKSTYKSFI